MTDCNAANCIWYLKLSLWKCFYELRGDVAALFIPRHPVSSGPQVGICLTPSQTPDSAGSLHGTFLAWSGGWRRGILIT